MSCNAESTGSWGGRCENFIGEYFVTGTHYYISKCPIRIEASFKLRRCFPHSYPSYPYQPISQNYSTKKHSHFVIQLNKLSKIEYQPPKPKLASRLISFQGGVNLSNRTVPITLISLPKKRHRRIPWGVRTAS